MFSRYEALCRENTYAIRDLGGPSECYLLLPLGADAAWPLDTRCPTGSRTTKGDTGLLIEEFGGTPHLAPL